MIFIFEYMLLVDCSKVKLVSMKERNFFMKNFKGLEIFIFSLFEVYLNYFFYGIFNYINIVKIS